MLVPKKSVSQHSVASLINEATMYSIMGLIAGQTFPQAAAPPRPGISVLPGPADQGSQAASASASLWRSLSVGAAAQGLAGQ